MTKENHNDKHKKNSSNRWSKKIAALQTRQNSACTVHHHDP
uniref:Uncharacterized protein n=1 Tax=Rhizophora mucronata TaxID=61149 RepID=A0A2P2N0K5_RHIMU